MKTTCYLQVEPTFYRWGSGDPTLREIRVKRVTQSRPRDPIPGSVIVKLTIDIADEAFLPLKPEATVVIPVTHTEPVLVESEPVEVLPEADSQVPA